MRIFFLALTAFFLSIFQLASAPRLALWGTAPNFILAGVVALAITAKYPAVKWLVFAWVLLFDLAAGGSFGILSLSFLLVFFLVNQLANFWLKQSGFWAVLFLGFLGIVFFHLSLYLFQEIFSLFSAPLAAAPKSFIPFLFLGWGVFYDLLAFLAIFFLFQKGKNFFSRFLK